MDRFTGPCPPWLHDLTVPLADRIGFTTLPLHIHHILFALIAYQLVYLVISPALSRLLVPQFYSSFNKRTQINWDVHVVSFVQSTFICTIALWGMFFDPERAAADTPLDRVFAYNVSGGAVMGYATGYFIWDLFVSVYHVDIMGLGFVAHAVSALAVFSLGFRPFVNWYAPVFILFELSSPFLNIHWFCDKLKLTGGKIQLINGIALLGTFFSARIAWGVYNSVMVFRDIFSIYANPPPAAGLEMLLVQDALVDAKVVSHPYEGMVVPLWLAAVYLGSNLTLNGLNFWWFSRMIVTVASRFKAPENVEGKGEKVLVEGTEVDLASAVEAVKKPRRRA